MYVCMYCSDGITHSGCSHRAKSHGRVWGHRRSAFWRRLFAERKNLPGNKFRSCIDQKILLADRKECKKNTFKPAAITLERSPLYT